MYIINIDEKNINEMDITDIVNNHMKYVEFLHAKPEYIKEIKEVQDHLNDDIMKKSNRRKTTWVFY